MDRLAEVLLNVLNPWVMGVVVGLALIFWIRLVIRYGHICFNRWDILLVAIAIGGTFAFELVLIAHTIECGALIYPCVNLAAVSAFSRVIRLTSVVALLVVGHAAGIRQRNAEVLMREAIDDTGSEPGG